MLILESLVRIDFKGFGGFSADFSYPRCLWILLCELSLLEYSLLQVLTQLVLASSFPRHVDPHDSDPSAMIVSLPYPISRAREFLRKTFLINPDKSAEIIRQKYPGFGRH